MGSTPTKFNTIYLPLDTTIDFVFIPRLSEILG